MNKEKNEIIDNYIVNLIKDKPNDIKVLKLLLKWKELCILESKQYNPLNDEE